MLTPNESILDLESIEVIAPVTNDGAEVIDIDSLTLDTSKEYRFQILPQMELAGNVIFETYRASSWERSAAKILATNRIPPASKRDSRKTKAGPLKAKSCSRGLITYILNSGEKRGKVCEKRSWTAIPIDLDAIKLPTAEVVEIVKKAFAAYHFMLWTTWSCRDDYASVRCIIPTEREMTHKEAISLWWWARAKLLEAKLPEESVKKGEPANDSRAMDGRLFYLPATPTPAVPNNEDWGGQLFKYYTTSKEGVSFLNPDSILTAAQALEEEASKAHLVKFPSVPVPGMNWKKAEAGKYSMYSSESKGTGGSYEVVDFGGIILFGESKTLLEAGMVLPIGGQVAIGSVCNPNVVWKEGEKAFDFTSANLHREEDGFWLHDFNGNKTYFHSGNTRPTTTTEVDLGDVFGFSDTTPEEKKPAVVVKNPVGWKATKDGIFRVRINDEGEEIATRISAPIVITGKETSVETGDVSLTLAWKGGKTSIPRAAARNGREIVKVAAKAHCPVASTNAHDIVEFLVAYEEVNTDIPSTRVTNRPGWHDKAFMLGNGECLGADDLRLAPVDGAQTMLAGMTQCGAWETWRDTLLPIAAKYPRVMAGIYASLVPVILPMLPTAEAFTIEWAGTTGTGKSTAMSVAASVWGSRQIIGTWNATRVGVEGLLSASGHLPVLLDDTKNCKWKGDIPQMLYDVTAGRGRVRGAAEGGMRAVPVWRTIVISTGEDACTSFSEDGGSRARAVVMQGDTLGATSLATASDARQLKELADLNYGHLGPMFVEAIRKMMETPDIWSKIQVQVAQNRARIAQKLVDRGAAASTADRMGSHITLIYLVETLVSKMLKMPLTTSVEEELIACVAAASSDVDPATRALADIRGWAVSHQDSFSGQRSATAFPPPQGWVGAWGVNDVSFLETVLREKLKGFGHSADSVLKTWEARGWLVMEGDRPRPKRSIGGKKMRVVAIKADIFDVSESDGMQQGTSNLGMDMFDEH